MKKISTFLIMLMAFSAAMLQAQDFTVLATPEEVLAHSVEDEDGAKADFKAILDNAEATDAEKTDAMHNYMKHATPAAGYAFDMSWLLSYNAVTAENKNEYTKTKLAEVYHCDVEGVTPSAENDVLMPAEAHNRIDLRITHTTLFMEEASFNKFLVYQNVILGAGSYQMTAETYAEGAGNCATLSAGDVDSDKKIVGWNDGTMLDHSVNFNITAEQEIKLGIKRNSTTGKLKIIRFNNLHLYKVSNIVEIDETSTEPVAATNVNVMVKREFEAGRYYLICLPFKVENWREVFADLLLWNNYEDGVLSFATVSGANTQARKPYLVKLDNDITSDNYLMFKNVNIERGNAGSWLKSVPEGEASFPVKMQGNWASMELPEKCYRFDGEKWVLAGSNVARSADVIEAYSAYIDATGLETCPESMGMKVNGVTMASIEVTEVAAAPAVVNVYNLQGMVIRTGVSEADALEGLPHGLYIVNGKKLVK